MLAPGARGVHVTLGPGETLTVPIAPGLVKTEFARALWEDPERLKRSIDILVDANALPRSPSVDEIFTGAFGVMLSQAMAATVS